MGGTRAARSHGAIADGGKSVVTANKQLIYTHGVELLAPALGISAAVRSVGGRRHSDRSRRRRRLAGDRLLRVAGILKGTCNYILTRMDSAGLSFTEALKEAWAAGYGRGGPVGRCRRLRRAHENPDLIALGLGCQVDPVHTPCRSISSIDRVRLPVREKADCTIRRFPRRSEGQVQTRGSLPRCVPRSCRSRRRSRARRAARTCERHR